MYKITTKEGTEMYSDNIRFVRMQKNGCLVLCEKAEAEGVVHKDTTYMFSDGNRITEVDGGAIIEAIFSQLMKISGEGVNIE